MNVKIRGTRIEITDELRALIEDKLNDALLSLGDMNLEPVNATVEVELTTRRHPKERSTEQRYRSEANLAIPGRLIRAEGTGPTLRRAVVQMKHNLDDEITSWRGRLIDAQRKGGRTAKEEGISPEARSEPEDVP